MWTSSRNKAAVFAALLFAFAAPALASGPIASITILGLSSNPSFTAGVATNTPTTTVFINTFASGPSTPDAGQVVKLEILSNGQVIDHAISPESFTTTGTGPLNGGNASLPITFFRAGTGIQLRATAGSVVKLSNTFTVNPSSATKLVVIGPGMTHYPGTNPALTKGWTGTFTPQEPNQAFPITVILTDNQFNQVAGNHAITFTSGDLVTPPSSGALSGGTGDFSMTVIGAQTTRDVVANDSTDPTVQPGTLSVTTAGPPAKEVFPFPSPFNPKRQDITFRFRLSDPKTVDLIVLTLQGEQVWQQEVSAGSGFTDVKWNGRNDEGAVVAAGVYYVLLKVDGSLESKKRFGVIK